MSDDELEKLRAILAKANYIPKKPGILGTLRRAVTRVFTSPKKAVDRQAEGKDRNENVA